MSSDMEQPTEQKKPSPSTQQSSSTKSAKIFKMIAAFLEHASDTTATLKSKVNSCFHFEIAPKQGQPATLKWTIDLRAAGSKQRPWQTK